mmetsp:Transcript_12783/g.15930  ORF Transcript_12783/g.15930 Transcript_12783/m.15930 type:complete len:87 (+) Transcript_12783:1132-1392(+)
MNDVAFLCLICFYSPPTGSALFGTIRSYWPDGVRSQTPICCVLCTHRKGPTIFGLEPLLLLWKSICACDVLFVIMDEDIDSSFFHP